MAKLFNQVRRYWYREDEYSMPIIARYGTGGGNMPVVLEALPFDTTQVTSPGNYSHPKWGDPCHPIANQGHTPKVVIREMEQEKEKALSVGNGQTNNVSMLPISNPLDCMHDKQAVMELKNDDQPRYIVRRLTPNECASLQGFPRNWRNIGKWTDSKGKKHKDVDTPKYKAYGNSIAVGFANERSGFWCWLMRRISAQYERRATQGSLFSGIGGFDLAWAAVNGPESVRWSSEIEEFPIAVLKTHFGDEDAGIEGDFYQAINGG